jgi:hypothetical protein
MTPCRALPLAIALLAVPLAPASAQIGPPPQCNDFLTLRQETETRGMAIKTASERKVPPAEACQLFNRYVAAESKMIKFMEDNRVWCGVPPEAIQAIKTAHGKALQMRQHVCSAGASAPKAKAPSLGDALGTTSIPDRNNSKTGRGTLDSLTGNPLAR